MKSLDEVKGRITEGDVGRNELWACGFSEKVIPGQVSGMDVYRTGLVVEVPTVRVGLRSTMVSQRLG